MEKLLKTKKGMLLCLAMACGLAWSANADSLSGLPDITAAGGELLTLTYGGITYVVADGDLTLGTTTRWYVANGVETLWEEGDPAPAATVGGTSNPKEGDVGSDADNFVLNVGGANDISSLDGIDFQETVFPYRSQMFFVLERGGNDNGTVQAILPGGELGDALTLTSGGAPYANTGISVNGQNAFGYVLETDVPVIGLRITASGHDAFTVCIPTRRVWPVAINPLPDQKNVPETATFEWTLEGEVQLDRYFLYLDEDRALIAEPNAPNAAAYDIFAMEVTPQSGDDPYASVVIDNIAEETVYYWRIDTQVLEPNESDPNGTTYNTSIIGGPVWRFEGISNIPEITSQPQDQYVLPDPDTHEWAPDTAASFTVGFSAGKPVKSYEWTRDGVPLDIDGVKYVVTDDVSDPAACTVTLTINNLTKADEGAYAVKITLNTVTQGSVASEDAMLYVSTDILVHRWSFNGDLADAISGADAVIVDPDDQNISLEDGELVFGGRMAAGDNMNSGDPNQHFVDLPNGIISALGNNMTLVAWFTWQGDSDWQRVCDFGLSAGGEGVSQGDSGDQDYIALTPRNGSNKLLRLQAALNPDVNLDHTAAAPVDQEICVAISWDNANGEFRMYVDGEYVSKADLPAGKPLSTLDDRNNWIGRSQWLDPLFVGSINELRIYSLPMTDPWARAIYEAGPDGEAVNLNPCMTAKPFDYNDDCVVDMEDFAIFASRWLECGYLFCN